VTLALIRYQHLHEKISSDYDLSRPQMFHTHVVPRIGGIGVFLAITFTGLVTLLFFELDRCLLLVKMACALPTFLIGILEDVTKKGVKTRLAVTVRSTGLLGYFLNAWIFSIQVSGIDWLLGIGIIQ
jgi:UDP-N-acetylmuramyl pentapeptide phosphotransferase/UDP-N-acetylglucosamine-1-phosphate transferase